jgi:hypothetical protein
MLVLASANCDAVKNIDLNTIGIRREHPSHVSFGYGNLSCLGLALAGLEARKSIGKRVHWHAA